MMYPQTSPCQHHECKHGVCFVPNPLSSEYICKCVPGYSGKRCEYLTSISFVHNNSFVEMEPLRTKPEANVTIAFSSSQQNGVFSKIHTIFIHDKCHFHANNFSKYQFDIYYRCYCMMDKVNTWLLNSSMDAFELAMTLVIIQFPRCTHLRYNLLSLVSVQCIILHIFLIKYIFLYNYSDGCGW